jgi:hypothetical protein
VEVAVAYFRGANPNMPGPTEGSYKTLNSWQSISWWRFKCRTTRIRMMPILAQRSTVSDIVSVLIIGKDGVIIISVSA